MVWWSSTKVLLRTAIIVQLLSHVRMFVIPGTAAHQDSLSFTISWSLLKLKSIESVMPPNHPILSPSLLLLLSIFPSLRVFSNESVFASGDQNIGGLASASVLPMNIQGWFPLGLTGLISFLSKWPSRVYSSTIWKHQFFGILCTTEC